MKGVVFMFRYTCDSKAERPISLFLKIRVCVREKGGLEEFFYLKIRIPEDSIENSIEVGNFKGQYLDFSNGKHVI